MEEPSSRVEGVIFDLDQTLVDSSRPHLTSYIVPLERRGIQVTEQSVRSLFGEFDSVIFRRLAPSATERDIAAMLTERYQILHREISSVAPISGADELFRALTGRYRLGLATGTVRSVVTATLKSLRWTGIFDAIVTGDEVAHPRPNPEILTKTASLMGVDPIRTVAVGDTALDAETATRARMIPLVVSERLTGAHVVPSLTIVRDRISSLSAPR